MINSGRLDTGMGVERKEGMTSPGQGMGEKVAPGETAWHGSFQEGKAVSRSTRCAQFLDSRNKSQGMGMWRRG